MFQNIIPLIINGINVNISKGQTILDVCKNFGFILPTFCYSSDLSKSGNCRICLVELENLEKLVASCLTILDSTTSVLTNSPAIQKIRLSTLGGLLLHHPLDCPICDQGGECDLQDETKLYGSSHSKNFFLKKSVEDKNGGPLIQTIMTRCILCTRCVRYAEEILGVNSIGTLNRGVYTEIGANISKLFESQLSGNVIDLCPVGALTSKPFSFKARPWELSVYETIDLTDSLGSNIQVNHKDLEILRILPKSNPKINANLISDKARFSYDANKKNRVLDIFINNKVSHWQEFMEIAGFEKTSRKFNDRLCKYFLKTEKTLNVCVTEEEPLESLIHIKKLKNITKTRIFFSNLDLIYNNTNFHVSDNLKIVEILSNTKNISIFFCTNTQIENSVLNGRLRVAFLANNSSNYVVGSVHEKKLDANFLNLNLLKSLSISESLVPDLTNIISTSAKGLLFLGTSLKSRLTQFNNFLLSLKKIFKNLKIIFLLNSCNSDSLSWLNARNFDLVNKNRGKILLNSREIVLTKKVMSKSFNLFLSSHMSSLISTSHCTFPLYSNFEESGTYLNQEHHLQKTKSFSNPIKEKRHFKDLFLLLAQTHATEKKNKRKYKSYFYFSDLYDGKNVADEKEKISFWYSHLEEKSRVLKTDNFTYIFLSHLNKLKLENKSLLNLTVWAYLYPIKLHLKNFYMSTNVSKSSKYMQNCSKSFTKDCINFKRVNNK
jgi:NADH dehydrogenase/NADH:ubiquinone oxidoreductase subunit G